MEASDAFTRRVLARCTEIATQTRGDTHIRLSDIRQVSHIIFAYRWIVTKNEGESGRRQ
jgi:hypothetical protein